MRFERVIKKKITKKPGTEGSPGPLCINTHIFFSFHKWQITR